MQHFPTPPTTSRLRWVAFTGVLFALLQSACAAVLAVSGVRVAIGLSALAAASGTYAPPTGFHQDAIRIPMLIVGTLGAVINLAVLFRVWSLRARASAKWRRRELSLRQRRSERWQLALSLLTLAVVAAELITHPMVHRTRPHVQAQSISTTPSKPAN
jgi:hypothetical protein